jgi:hypothetical protein
VEVEQAPPTIQSGTAATKASATSLFRLMSLTAGDATAVHTMLIDSVFTDRQLPRITVN